jgi:hypothetical protein
VKVFGADDESHVVADVGLEQDAAEHGPLGIDIGRTVTTVERHGRCCIVAEAALPAPS